MIWRQENLKAMEGEGGSTLLRWNDEDRGEGEDQNRLNVQESEYVQNKVGDGWNERGWEGLIMEPWVGRRVRIGWNCSVQRMDARVQLDLIILASCGMRS